MDLLHGTILPDQTIWIVCALFYVFDNLRSLGSRQLVLSERLNGQWTPLFPLHRYRWAGRALVVLNPLLPWLGAVKMDWLTEDAFGRHANWGEVAPMGRDDFVRRVGELLLQMMHGEEGRVELKTLEATYELFSRVASTIDGFIQQHGLSEFASNRLHVVINEEYRVSISARARVKNALVSVPLSDLKLNGAAVREGGPLRRAAVDRAAQSVIARLPS
jgi:hypothetical protein